MYRICGYRYGRDLEQAGARFDGDERLLPRGHSSSRRRCRAASRGAGPCELRVLDDERRGGVGVLVERRRIELEAAGADGIWRLERVLGVALQHHRPYVLAGFAAIVEVGAGAGAVDDGASSSRRTT